MAIEKKKNYLEKNITEDFQKQNFILPHPDNYLISIYILLCIYYSIVLLYINNQFRGELTCTEGCTKDICKYYIISYRVLELP